MEEDTAQTTNSQASDATAVPWVWLPMEWTWWVIAQLVSAILGICGNLLVMLVLFNKDRVRRSTDTLIGALAFADFLTSVFFIPHPRIATLPSDTWLAQFYCRIIHTSQIKWVAAVASVFTLTAISLERYLAIAHPLFFLRNVNPARTSMCIFIIWVAAFATNSYQVVVGHAAGNACVVMFPSQSARFAIGLSVFIVKFFLPMMVMILAQIMTAVFLHRQSLQFQEGNSINGRSNANMNHIVAKKRVIHMLFLVTTVFVVCWGPDQIFFLMLNLSLLDISFVYGLVHRTEDTEKEDFTAYDYDMTTLETDTNTDEGIKYVPSTWLGEVYCRVVNGQIFMWFFVNVSIFILTAISVERYVAVIYPFTFRRIFSMRRTTVYIILIWMACVINYVIWFYFFIKVHHATHTCQVPTDPPSLRLLGGLSQVVFKFIFPLFVMIITQAMIIINLHRQAKRFKFMNGSKEKTTHAIKSHDAKRRVIKMLLLVVLTFMVCWSPSQTSFLLYSAQIIGPRYLYSPLNRIFTVMGFYNSCANPIIYTISNAKFRLAVKNVLTRKGSDNISVFGIKPETDNPDTVMSSAHSA
eukprot:XP_011683245.1 PREDICTED: uncharacterized protein LOC105447184 [Strongylocentrotus purpuratus]